MYHCHIANKLTNNVFRKFSAFITDAEIFRKKIEKQTIIILIR